MLVEAVPLMAPLDLVGQNAWCWVSMSSGTAFCDYRNYGACVDSNAHDEGICIVNADWKHKS
jgi:hypothetical protein